ncbi:mandelate racemase/muconate lactonizing enzyme family protein [Roseivivax sp.]
MTSDLTITAVETREYQWERETPIQNGLHTYTHHEISFVEVQTSAGITGYGIGRPRPGERGFRNSFAKKLIGRDPLMTEAIWADLWSPKLYGRRGQETRALSSIDMALWDIRGKLAGLPLYRLVGGYRKDIPFYTAGGYYAPGKGLTELAQEMAGYVEKGARAVKMKVGAVEIPEDVARVRAVRQAIEPDIKLMIDANCAYRAYDAISLARRVEDQDIFWFEEPVQPDDYAGFRRIFEATGMTLATGENEYTKHGFRDLIATGAISILQPDARYTGGVTEFLKIAALAQAHGLDICPHGDQLAHLSLLAAIPNARMLEYYPKAPGMADAFLHTRPVNADGTITVPEVPGMGLDPNPEFLRHAKRLA